MEWTCLYHPTEPMRVVSDQAEHDYLVNTGAWFHHPHDAEKMRNDYEKRISEAGSKPSVCDEGTDETKQKRRKKSEDGLGDVKD